MAIMQTRRLTAEEFAALPDHGGRTELVAGEVVAMAPVGGEHGGATVRLVVALDRWAGRHGGRALGSDVGFVLRRGPDTVRAPDVALFLGDRCPQPLPRGFLEVPPDLVVEVVSPSDRERDVLAKVGEWLDAGVREVWVAWPAAQRVTVHRAGGDARGYTAAETLASPDLLPGFSLAVAEVFS